MFFNSGHTSYVVTYFLIVTYFLMLLTYLMFFYTGHTSYVVTYFLMLLTYFLMLLNTFFSDILLLIIFAKPQQPLDMLS